MVHTSSTRTQVGPAYTYRATAPACHGSCCGCSWEEGPRSAAELKEAAKHFERAAGLHPAPAGKAQLACWAEQPSHESKKIKIRLLSPRSTLKRRTIYLRAPSQQI
eukprot:scaffold34947_cov62-Phaeocystis_antarctica.AAC.3